MTKGVHFNIQNNIWNTNYPLWYPFVESDANVRSRFELEFVPAKATAVPSPPKGMS